MSAQPLRVQFLEDDAGDARLCLASLCPRQAGLEVVHVTCLGWCHQRSPRARWR